ncbi:hypothetical protein PC123_g7290 [Phytophthora cactorum]|nr:hypothetical protein PC123_g7290 [Phytophthora cactorum]
MIIFPGSATARSGSRSLRAGRCESSFPTHSGPLSHQDSNEHHELFRMLLSQGPLYACQSLCGRFYGVLTSNGRAGSFKRCQTSITWCCSADPALGAQDGFALHAKAGTDVDTADKAAKAKRKNVNTSSILLAVGLGAIRMRKQDVVYPPPRYVQAATKGMIEKRLQDLA